MTMMDVAVLPPEDHHFATLAAVRAALARGSDEAALAALKGASAESVVAGHLMRARHLKSARRMNEALKAFQMAEEAANPAPLAAEVCAEIADILLHLGEMDRVEAALDRALERHPEALALKLRRAAVHAARKNLAEAEGLIRSSFMSAAYVPALDAQLAKSIRAIQAASAAQAFGLAEEACLQHAGSGILARIKGETAHRLRKYEVAIEAFERALDLLKEGAVREAAIAGLERAKRALGQKVAETTQRSLAMASIHTRPFLVCALTNVYNENFNLPIWLRHYGQQVGIKNCIVLDNGTDDGSTDDLRGANRIPMPRGPVFNERHRMKIITDLANNLLNYYDAVLYSDCDEMLVPNPLKYETITDYAARMKGPVVHSIGLNVRQDITREYAIESGPPILSQRSLVHFVSAMCKPLITRRPISWGGGFHSCDHPPNFDDIYLFHLRHLDMGQALARLSVTREISFAREGGGKHHRREDLDLVTAMYATTHKMPVVESFDFTDVLAQHKAGVELSFSGRYAVKRAVNCKYLFRIPDHFRCAF